MLRLTGRVAIALVVACFSMITPTGSGRCDGIVTGGLDAPETGVHVWGRIFWSTEICAPDFRGGRSTLPASASKGAAIPPACGCRNRAPSRYPSAKNAFKCPPGLYTISAEIKTQTTITVPKRHGGTRIRLIESPGKKWAMTNPGCRYDRLDYRGESARRGRRWQHRFVPRGDRGTGRGTSWFRKLFAGPRASRTAGNLSALPELSGNDVQRPEPGRAGRHRCQSACGHHHGAASRRARSDGFGRKGAFDPSAVATGEWLDGRDRGHGQPCRLDDIGCRDIWKGPATSESSRNRPTRSSRSAARRAPR